MFFDFSIDELRLYQPNRNEPVDFDGFILTVQAGLAGFAPLL